MPAGTPQTMAPEACSTLELRSCQAAKDSPLAPGVKKGCPLFWWKLIETARASSLHMVTAHAKSSPGNASLSESVSAQVIDCMLGQRNSLKAACCLALTLRLLCERFVLYALWLLVNCGWHHCRWHVMTQAHPPVLCLQLVFAAETDSATKLQVQHAVHGMYALDNKCGGIMPIVLLEEISARRVRRIRTL